MTIPIVPAVLVPTFDELRVKLGRVRSLAPLVQLDICDGYFVPSRTWPLNPGDQELFKRIVKGDEALPYWGDFDFEVDLMVQKPEKMLADWVRAGISRAVFHLESSHDFSALKQVQAEIELGMAIDLDPPYERVASYIDHVDYIQIMGIGKIGKQGEQPDERAYDLIRKVRADFPNVTIQVDGGVNHETAQKLIEAGANRLVVGSYLLNSDNPKEAIASLQHAVD